MAYFDHMTVNEVSDLKKLVEKGGIEQILSQFTTGVQIIAGRLDQKEMIKLYGLAGRAGLGVQMVQPPPSVFTSVKDPDPEPEEYDDLQEEISWADLEPEPSAEDDDVDMAKAKLIMGQNNFIGPDDFQIVFPNQATGSFPGMDKVPFSSELLVAQWSHCVLVWLPRVSLEAMTREHPDHFENRTRQSSVGSWSAQGEFFGWRLLRKEPLISQISFPTFNDLQKLHGSADTTTASLKLMTYAHLALVLKTKEKLFKGSWGVCRDRYQGSPLSRVAFGINGADRIQFGPIPHPDSDLVQSIGLAVEFDYDAGLPC